MALQAIYKDWSSYTIGDFRFSNNVWNKGVLVNGTDFSQSIAFDTLSPTTSATFLWDWGTDRGHMVAYPEVIVGYKPWDDVGTDIISSKVSDIREFTVSHDVSISGDVDLFNVSYDLWLTDAPTAGEKSITTEVMLWTHSGKLANFHNAEHAGTYSQGNINAEIYTFENFGGSHGIHWRYVAIIPDRTYNEGTFDFKSMLQKLVKLDLVSADDYVNGYELGSEVRGGRGQLTINSMSHQFEASTEDNRPTSILGTFGRDNLVGTDGNDIIRGFSGRDIIRSGDGADTISGGKGRDVFVLSGLDVNADDILDFTHGRDKIALDSDVFKALRGDVSHGRVSDVHGRAVWNDFDSHITYDRSTGALYYVDTLDGGESDPLAIAHISNGSRLTWSDFDIV